MNRKIEGFNYYEKPYEIYKQEATCPNCGTFTMFGWEEVNYVSKGWFKTEVETKTIYTCRECFCEWSIK